LSLIPKLWIGCYSFHTFEIDLASQQIDACDLDRQFLSKLENATLGFAK
jgi:hypothetical protein